MKLAIWGWAAAVLALGVIAASLGFGMLRAQQTARTVVGQPAADLTIASLDGQHLQLSSLRGKPVVLNFWASWCVPCRQEAPVLNAAAQRYQGRVQFVGVDIQDSDGPARAFQAEFQSPYPVGPAMRGSYRDFRVTAPPETLFIDRRGMVSARIIGPVDAKRLDLYLGQLQP